MPSMCCVTEELLASESYLKDFTEVTQPLSMKDVATILEVFEFALSEVPTRFIQGILTNGNGSYLFKIGTEEGSFDLYGFLNKNYNSEVTINCVNAKKMFPRGMSNGMFVGEEISTNDMAEDDEEGATGYMDEAELEGLVETCNLSLKWVRTGNTLPISSDVLRVGRSVKKSDYVITGNTNISREHCRVFCRGCSLILVDNSNNGTYRNGSRLEKGKEVVLNVGDIVSMADERFEVVEV